MRKTLGKIISEQRIRLGYSQRQLAKDINVSNSTISRIENNDNIVPCSKTLKALANCLDLDYYYLLTITDLIDDDPTLRKFQNFYNLLTDAEKRDLQILLFDNFPKAYKASFSE